MNKVSRKMNSSCIYLKLFDKQDGLKFHEEIALFLKFLLRPAQIEELNHFNELFPYNFTLMKKERTAFELFEKEVKTI
jgi:hypothetical protein